MKDRLTLLPLLVFEDLHSTESGAACEQLMTELALVVGLVLVVDLIVVILTFTPAEHVEQVGWRIGSGLVLLCLGCLC